MLAEKIDRWTQEWKREGREEGLEEGVAQGKKLSLISTLHRVCRKRFGVIDLGSKLESAEIDQLELWLDRAIDVEAFEDVFA